MDAGGKVARLRGVGDSGYRVIANTGPHGHQEVPHLHSHVIGRKQLDTMLPRD